MGDGAVTFLFLETGECSRAAACVFFFFLFLLSILCRDFFFCGCLLHLWSLKSGVHLQFCWYSAVV